MTIISSGKLLVSTNYKLFVYDIPSFKCLNYVIAQVAAPVWEQEFEIGNRVITPLLHVIHPTPDAHLEGLMVIWTGSMFMKLTPST